MKLLLLAAAALLAQDGPDFTGLFKNGPAIGGKVPADVTYPDLSHEFLDPPSRNQKELGSCHAFAAVGLLEAAYYRQHRHRIRFSEEDVFIQGTLLTGYAYTSIPCEFGEQCELNDGGFVAADVEHVLKQGVLTGSAYDDFAERYGKLRDRHEKARRAMAAEHLAANPLWQFFNKPETTWEKFLANKGNRAAVQKELSRSDSRVESERANIKKLLAGSRLRNKELEFVDGAQLTDQACDQYGRERAALIVGELELARPVAVGMLLDGLAAWGAAGSNEHARHAFLITGYTKKDGKLVFKTRNSWGGDNPDVLQHEACRIYRVQSVLAPGERETF